MRKSIRNTESTAVVYLNSFICNVPGGLGGEDLGDGGLHVEVLVASVHKHRSFYLAAKEQSRFLWKSLEQRNKHMCYHCEDFNCAIIFQSNVRNMINYWLSLSIHR